MAKQLQANNIKMSDNPKNEIYYQFICKVVNEYITSLIDNVSVKQQNSFKIQQQNQQKQNLNEIFSQIQTVIQDYQQNVHKFLIKNDKIKQGNLDLNLENQIGNDFIMENEEKTKRNLIQKSQQKESSDIPEDTSIQEFPANFKQIEFKLIRQEYISSNKKKTIYQNQNEKINQNIYKKQENTNPKNSYQSLESWIYLKKEKLISDQWQYYYAILSPEEFLIYQNISKKKLIGRINFKYTKCQHFIYQDNKTSLKNQQQMLRFVLKIEDSNKTLQYTFEQTKCYEFINDWVDQIQINIEKYKNSNKIKGEKFFYLYFRSKYLISENDIEVYGESGDILLFQTNNIGAKLQRGFTRSEFDHVAMIIRIGNLIYVFDTQSDRVFFYIFYFFYQGMLYDDVERLSHLQQFVYQNCLQKIKLSLKRANRLKIDYICQCNLIFFRKHYFYQNTIGTKFELSLNQNKSHPNKTYFCSELIATAYMEVELLNKNSKCNSFWPSTFGSKSQIKLEKNARLGKIVHIVCSKYLN